MEVICPLGLFGDRKATIGILDDDVKFIMTHGGCNLFAKILSEKTGWKIYHVTLYETFENMTIPTGIHVVCKLPDGKFCDVEGIKTKEDLFSDYQKYMTDYMMSGSSLFPYIIDTGCWLTDYIFVCQNKRFIISPGSVDSVADDESIKLLAESVIENFVNSLNFSSKY